MRTARFFENRKSQVLIVSVIVMVLVLTLGAGLLFNSRTFRDITDLELEIQKAGSLSRSGIGIMQTLVAQSGCGDPLDPSYTYNLGDGTINIVVDPDAKTITSTGRSGQSTDVRQIAFEPTSSSGWDFWRKITIKRLDTHFIYGDLNNFPVLVKMDLNENNVEQSDGGDIKFTDSTGETQLDHEIEEYNSTNGDLIAWVRVPVLQAAADTIIYVYYGNDDPLLPDQWNSAGVWDANYLAVWHMDEDPTGPAPQTKDSTNYGHDGTSRGPMEPTDLVDAQIGRGVDFDRDGDVIDIMGTNASGHVLDFTAGPFTLSAWYNEPTDFSQGGSLISKRDGGTAQYQLFTRSIGQILTKADDKIGKGDTTTPWGTWHYGSVVVDSSNMPELYLNGSQETWTSEVGPRPHDYIHQGVNVSIGARFGGYQTVGFEFEGIIDEVRISNIDRSADWIRADYKNQNDVTSFMYFGTEESCI